MGERKVINKYYPPDFDPSKIPKKKRPKNEQIKVRMMLPMSIRCNTCGEYLYKGKKFNARKETVIGEEYLGVKIFRFYIKCTRCSSELTLKTDPEHSDYACEAGASRNFEPWREQQRIEEEIKKKRENEEEGDPMKSLENRTTDSKMEMDILDALDEIKALRARQSRIDYESLFSNQKRKYQDTDGNDLELDADDEKYIESVFQNKLRRIEDSDDSSDSDGTNDVDNNVNKEDVKEDAKEIAKAPLPQPKPKPTIQFIVKPKNAPTAPPKMEATAKKIPTAVNHSEENTNPLQLLADYGT